MPSPVFVDRTGRRRRLVVAIGAALAAGLLVSLMLLLAGLFTGGPLPLPGWPDGGQRGQGELGADRPPSPTAAVPTGNPGLPRTPPSATASVPVGAAPSTGKPGQGQQHRATPNPGRPSKSPGKPR